MSRPVSRATATWGVLRSVWAVNRKLREEGRTDGATVEEVLEHLLTHREEPIDYRTVATHLRTLEAKELLVSHKQGRKLYYRPVVDEVAAVSAEIRAFFDHVIHRAPALLDELERQLLEERDEAQHQAPERSRERSRTS